MISISDLTSTFPLQQELCQRIHFTAIHTALRENLALPSSMKLSLENLSTLQQMYGTDLCLMPPKRIQDVFQNVTLGVYQLIEQLYCHRLSRNIDTIFKLLNKLKTSGIVSHEAVWAICLYLSERRSKKTKLNIEIKDKAWNITHITVENQHISNIICVVEPETNRVLAFQSLSPSDELQEVISTTLLEAIVSERGPVNGKSIARILWKLPQSILINLDGLNTTADCHLNSSTIHPSISFKQARQKLPFIAAIETDWQPLNQDHNLNSSEFVQLFDRFLRANYGYGPKQILHRIYKEYFRAFDHQLDPTFQFPALRQLLPENVTVVEDGMVVYSDLHYEDEHLVHFEGEQVTVRPSPMAENYIWIYLDGEVLCQAWAKELRRADGSYRPNRYRRNKL